MDLLLYQAKEGDIYYCKENKKLYVRSFNKWDMSDPTVRPDKLSKVEFWIEKNK